MISFHLSDADCAKIMTFMSEEDKKTGGAYGAIGGAYTYTFTPTSIGVAATVENTVTKAVLDLSDYGSW
jgi:hypothetical protein